MTQKFTIDAEVVALRAKIGELVNESIRPLSSKSRKVVDTQLRELISELEIVLGKIDPISQPRAIFDPSNPRIIGRFTALALLAQERQPLQQVPRFYGSGVYAIYYTGKFELYRAISKSETPIYVGQAAPGEQGARTARDQGERLAARLNEHRKNIIKAASTLFISDFEARYLVVQSGWETSAEDYLIHLFKPIWNSETNILYGLGKHGDSADTRGNRRSPWDTLHPGRKWAAASAQDAKSIEQIKSELDLHFNDVPPIIDRTELLDLFFAELNQAG